MLLKDITAHLFTLSNTNSTYNSDPWYLFTQSRLSSYINRRMGRRPVFPWIQDAEQPGQETAEAIDALFEGNAYKYRHLWELYTAEYNPIWNYDGTDEETVTRALQGAHGSDKVNTGTETRADTGTQTSADTGTQTRANTGTQSDRDTGTQTTGNTGTVTTADTGTVTTADTGTQTTANTGTQGTVHGGTDTITKGNTSTKSVTSYDSATWHDAEKTVDSGSDATAYGHTETRTDNLQSQRTDALQSQRTDNLQTQRTDALQQLVTNDLTRTRTDNLTEMRTDNLQHQRTDNLQSQRTDNLREQIEGTTSENETISTVRKRGGNQGTTTTQSMEQEELAWIGAFNFLEIIAADVAGELSYIYY